MVHGRGDLIKIRNRRARRARRVLLLLLLLLLLLSCSIDCRPAGSPAFVLHDPGIRIYANFPDIITTIARLWVPGGTANGYTHVKPRKRLATAAARPTKKKTPYKNTVLKKQK